MYEAAWRAAAVYCLTANAAAYTARLPSLIQLQSRGGRIEKLKGPEPIQMHISNLFHISVHKAINPRSLLRHNTKTGSKGSKFYLTS